MKKNKIHSDVLKLLYLGMLEELENQYVKSFWLNSVPDFSNQYRNQEELFESLWSESHWIDANVVLNVFNDLEKFLLKHGIEVKDFIGRIIQYFSKTNIVFARTFLIVAQDKLGVFYKERDIYVELISLLTLFFKEMVPALSFEIVEVKNVNECTETIIKCDKNDEGVTLAANFGLWLGVFIKYIPLSFGIDAFKEFAVSSSLEGLVTPVEDDSSAIYVKFVHKRISDTKESFLKNIIEHATSNNKKEWDKLKNSHNEIIRSINNTTSIAYHVSDDSISVNGKHLVKSVPAQIFGKMMKIYHGCGRTEFEYREFLRDKTIILDPLNPNLSIRIQRLQSLLDKKLDGVSIEKKGQGKFALVLKKDIHFFEEA